MTRGVLVDAHLDITLGWHTLELRSVPGELTLSIPNPVAAFALGRTAHKLGYLSNVHQHADRLHRALEFCNTRLRVTLMGKTLALIGGGEPLGWVERLALWSPREDRE